MARKTEAAGKKAWTNKKKKRAEAQIERDDEFIDNSYIIHGQRPTADISLSVVTERAPVSCRTAGTQAHFPFDRIPNAYCTVYIRSSLFYCRLEYSIHFVHPRVRCVRVVLAFECERSSSRWCRRFRKLVAISNKRWSENIPCKNYAHACRQTHTHRHAHRAHRRGQCVRDLH